MVDFLTEYRLQQGGVFERHGLITGPQGNWSKATAGAVELLRVEVAMDPNLPEDVGSGYKTT